MAEVPESFKYSAFLSYSRRDRSAANAWHRRLEKYRIDPLLIGRASKVGTVQGNLKNIFIDRLDFPVDETLPAATWKALADSAALILLASPNAARSKNVNAEVKAFLHRFPNRPKIAIILDGAPDSAEQQCFPRAYRFVLDENGQETATPVDWLAADPRRKAEGEAVAFAKVVATLLGLQEERGVLTRIASDRRRRRWLVLLRVGLVACCVIVLITAVWWYLVRPIGKIEETTTATAQTVGNIRAGTTDLQQRLDRIEAGVALAAAGGPKAAKALAEIRELLRRDIPNIDAVSDEKLPGEVQRILAEARKPPPEREDFDSTVGRVLKEARDRIGLLALADAAKGLDDALAMALAEGEKVARGHAALLAERGRVSSLRLNYREAARFYTRASEVVAFNRNATWSYLTFAGIELYKQGDEFGDNDALREAIILYRKAISLGPRDRVPLDWAATQNSLGNALSILGKRESGTTRLEQAIEAYHEALLIRTHDSVPLAWAVTQINLGGVLQILGRRESGTMRLEQSIEAYSAVLSKISSKDMPLIWAAAQAGLGVVLSTFGERERNNTARLVQAVEAFRAALQVYSIQPVLFDWAMAQNNLGNALQRLGQRERGTLRLEQAVDAYRSALQVYTAQRVPLNWAMVQNNLGNVLRVLGERESGTTRFEQAADAYRAALQERTRGHVPLDWAETQYNFANTLAILATRTQSRDQLREAVTRMRDAAEVFRDGDAYWFPIAQRRIAEIEAQLAVMPP